METSSFGVIIHLTKKTKPKTNKDHLSTKCIVNSSSVKDITQITEETWKRSENSLATMYVCIS